MVASLFSSFDVGGGSWLSCLLVMGWWLGGWGYGLGGSSGLVGALKSGLASSLAVMVYSPGYLSGITLSVGVFLGVVSVNTLGLLPYVFTSTSHICFSFPLCVGCWLGFTGWCWVSAPGAALMATVPVGTPGVLMPFMVVIESISLLIRPVTLSIRLTANIVAGHCLLSLVSEGFGWWVGWLPTVVFQTLLMGLEVAVAVIQGFVLVVLLTLYSKGTFGGEWDRSILVVGV